MTATSQDPATVVCHLAHELQQPLRAIESIAFYLDMVLPRTEAKARRQLGALQRQVQQIQWIIADSVNFLQATPPHFEWLDLTEVIARNASEWASGEPPMVQLDLEPELPLIRADLEQARHLVRNLVGFFLRISRPDRHTLRLRTFAADREVRFEVRTTSPGYEIGEIERLRDPLASDWPTGTGLGLASARRIADAHGARLDIRSDAAGVSVVVAFPAAAEGSQQSAGA